MILVGLTGGIGSGKSTVAARFAAHGWPVVDADAVAREVVEPGGPALPWLVEHFGGEVLTPEGTLDRGALARLAFASEEGRAALNALTHPHIGERIADRLAALRADRTEVAVLDHPLLIETGQAPTVDVVVVVLAPEDLRVARLVTVRGLDEADARARIAAQTDDEARRAAADHVIDNDGTLDELHAAVDRVVAAIGRDLPADRSGPRRWS